MRSLNLDKNFKPIEGSEIEYKSFYFPGGEYSIKLLTDISNKDVVVTITHRLTKPAHIIELMMAVNALRNENIKNIELYIPYIPYARQDRKCDKGEAMSSRVFTELINSLKFNKVTVMDPHSDVSHVFLDNVEVINNHAFVAHAIWDNLGLSINGLDEGEYISVRRTPYIVSPDAGALKKIHNLTSYLHDVQGLNVNMIEGSKKRNTSNGQLTGFSISGASDESLIPGEWDLNNKDCFIVDDICDGGGTFLGLAKVLKEHNAGRIYLVVTHGIFSRGMEIFKENDLFEGVYSTNSFKNLEIYNGLDANFVKQYTLKI